MKFRVTLGMLGVLGLSGCSVSTGMTALTVQNDRVVALVRLCSGISSERVEIASPRSKEPLDSWMHEDGSSANVDLGNRSTFLELVGDQRLNAASIASSGHAEAVWFDAADLDALSEGHVLLGGSADDEAELIKVAEFEALVLDQCDSIQ